MSKSSTVRGVAIRLLRVLGLLAVLVVVSMVYLYPQVFYCETISLSDFRRINSQIFVSPDTKTSSNKQIQAIVRASAARVDSFYTGSRSKPRIIVCSDSEQYRKYCNSSEGAGCSLATPWGHSFVIVNSLDLNVDVVSHEMSHVELVTQLGWWKTLTEIPQWFNEGVALMLDRRFVADRDPVERYLSYRGEWIYRRFRNGRKIVLKDISSFKGFFGNDSQGVMYAYISSGMEISYWLAVCGTDAWDKLSAEIRKGVPFESAYKTGLRQAGKIKLPENPFHAKSPPKNCH